MIKKNKKKYLNKYIVSHNSSIIFSLKKITSNQSKACVVIKNNKFLKVVTDGDIRRFLIKGFSVKDKIEKVHNRKSKFIFEHNLIIDKKSYLNSRISLMPVLNKKLEVVDILIDNKESKILNIKQKKIAIVGLGYVGLTLALVLADNGFNVIGYDINNKTIDKIRKSQSPFYERYINEYLNKNLNNNLFVTNNINKVNADVYIVCVGTPINTKTKKPNIKILSNAVTKVAKIINKGDLIILRSTVPTGFTRNKIIPIIEKNSNLKAGADFKISFCPERTIEGKALDELSDLPQIIGGFDRESTELSIKFFSTYSRTVVDVGSLEASELCKLIDNSYRDLRFAYSNQISLLCESLGLNAFELISKVNLGYHRNDIAYPSPGVGGPCLTKDPYILHNNFIEKNLNNNLILNARKVNEIIPKKIFERIFKLLKSKNKNKKNIKIFLIGFAFKGEPETSDIRDSTTLAFLKILIKNGYKNIYGYDPVVNSKEIKKLGIKFSNLETGFKKADLVLFMNNHKMYANLNIISLAKQMNNNSILYDSWNIYKSDIFNSLNNLSFLGIGK